jgi:pantoate--beta-alanine ligase
LFHEVNRPRQINRGGAGVAQQGDLRGPGRAPRSPRITPRSVGCEHHAVRAGNTDFEALQVKAVDTLTTKGWQTDYVEIKRQADLGAPHGGQPLVVLAAARLGRTRLIDNLEI